MGMTVSEAGRKGGKANKLTPELQEQICSLVEETACSVYTACLSLGIPWAKVYYWEQWGREGKQPYERFLEAVTQARAKAEINLLREFKEADRERQRPTQYYPFVLERRFPGEYSARTKISESIAALPDAAIESGIADLRARIAAPLRGGEGGATGGGPVVIDGELGDGSE